MFCQLDTGVSCNVISYPDLLILLQNGKPKVGQSSVKLEMYDGSIMRPTGEMVLKVKHNDSYCTLKFQVVDSQNKPLLSAQSCEMLGLLQLNLNVPKDVHVVESTPKPPLSKDAILNKFKDVFEGLGHISNSTFVTDETVKPVQHTPRCVPVTLWDDVKEKLLDLEKRGIIKKVTAPTEWISSMFIVARLGKIRICSDPRDLRCNWVQLGVTLLQGGQPVAFASRTLSWTERNYAQLEKECLAIVFGCQRFDQFLAWKDKILAKTDHIPLQPIFKKPIHAAPCHLQRMLLRLLRYNLDVIYKMYSTWSRERRQGAQWISSVHNRVWEHEPLWCYEVVAWEISPTPNMYVSRPSSDDT